MGDGKGGKDFIDNESVWTSCQRIGLEELRWSLGSDPKDILRSKIKQKCHPILPPFLAHE